MYRLRSRSMAFTLIELLVVVAIIAVLISFLLPALAAARNMAKRAACSSNQRQMFVSMMDYANEFNGWGPFRVYYATANQVAHNGWFQNYFQATTRKNPLSGTSYDTCDVLACPATSPVIMANTAYAPGKVTSTAAYTSYFIQFGLGSHTCAPDPTEYACFYGWHAYWQPLETNGLRAPCPKVDFLDRWLPGSRYSTALGTYIPLPDEMRDYRYRVAAPCDSAAVMDTYWPTKDFVQFYGAYGPHNHYGEEGKNVTLMDGHTEWRGKDKIQLRWGGYQGPPDSQCDQYWY